MSAQVVWLGGLLLRSLLVIGAAALVVMLLRRQSAAARHAVWTGALVALLAAPALTLVLPRLRVPLLPTPDPVGAEFVAINAVPEPTDERAPDDSRQLRSERVTFDAPLGFQGISVWLVTLWLCGMLALLCRRLFSELQSRRLVLAASPARADLERLCAAESERLSLGRVPPVLSSTIVAVPAVAGVVRPVVLLPMGVNDWSEADAAAALVHELGHIRRHDGVLNLLADLAVSMYWCNPAVWLARSRMRAESERACDDLVLARGTDPDVYAALLLRAVRECHDRTFPSAAVAMARPHQLEARLMAVLDDRVRRSAPSRRISVLLATTAMLVVLPACAVTLQEAPAHDQPTAAEPDRAGDALALPASERLPALSNGHAVPADAVAALQGPDSALVARLIAALEHEPQHDADLVRDRAAWALAQAHDGRLIEPLVAALGASDWRVQSYAAWALATARDPRAVPPLIALLDHPIWRLRAMAAAALRESADPRAINGMTAALGDAAWQVRLEAVGYFLSVDAPGMEERLRARRDDRHIAVRLAARRGILSP